MDMFYFVCQQTLIYTIPLLIVACAGIFSEKGGILNFALEGNMLIGAFSGALFLHGFDNGTNLHYLIALLIAGGAGVLIILPHAFASISLKAHQAISALAIILLVPPATIISARAIVGRLQIGFVNNYTISAVPGLSEIPIIGGIFFTNTYITTLIGVIVLLVTLWVLNKSKFGVHLKACGENPEAAASMGINVARTRYIGVLVSGFIAGIGGLAFIVPNATEYSASVAGYGFLAVAVIIFGQWDPMKILWASLFFGFMKTVASAYSTMPFLAGLDVTNYWYKMVPYAATVAVLAFTSKGSGRPRALGVIYENSGR